MSSRVPPIQFPEPATVVVGANVFYSSNQRNVLATMVTDGLFRLRGSEEIEDEWVRNLIAGCPNAYPSRFRELLHCYDSMFSITSS